MQFLTCVEKHQNFTYDLVLYNFGWLRLRPEPEVDLAGAPAPAGGLFRTSGRSLIWVYVATCKKFWSKSVNIDVSAVSHI